MHALGICLMVAVAAFGQAKPGTAYSAAVSKYVANDFSGAADELGTLQQRDIQKEIEAIVRIVTAANEDGAKKRLEAAAMLHTDYAMLADLDDAGVQFHVNMARLLLTFDRAQAQRVRPALSVDSTQEHPDQARAREFFPHWYAVAACALLLRGLDRPARTLVDEGLKVLPENPKLLFWQALAAEFQAVWHPTLSLNPHPELMAMSYANPSGFDMQYILRVWDVVQAAHRRALAADPENQEIRLHLGYALVAMRKPSEARAELESARTRAADPYVVYLADLFLARLDEDGGDPAAAASGYERALATLPLSQSAYVGLSLLEARRGNAQRARELVAKFAGLPRDRVDDPWWAFHAIRIPVDDLRWLRNRVRQ